MDIQSQVDLWNLLHDGCIEQIDVREKKVLLWVGIEYLLERLQPPAEYICIELLETTRFDLTQGSESSNMVSIQKVESIYVGILSAQQEGSAVKVFTDHGSISIESASTRLSFDDGRKTSLAHLKELATGYWDEFGADKSR